jgi:hypothetical protein
MTPEDRVAKALRCPEPTSVLRAVVQALADEGSSKLEIYGLLEKALVQVRERSEPAEEEEVVLDVMSALAGWCHPSAEIRPEKPSR